MSNQHHVHIQISNHEPLSINVHDDDTIASLLARFHDEHPNMGNEASSLVVFVGESDEEVPHDRKLCDCHCNGPKILHCHRCRKVKVSVSYNGEETRKFGPNAKIRRVTKWAKKQFAVDTDRKWVLRLDGAEGDILDPDTNLGKLVKSKDCNLSLFLTERCLIQG